MPKKSKREKMLADIRRRVRTERVLTVPAAVSPIKTQPSTFQFTMANSSKRQEAPPANNSELIAIKRDLTKTVVLALVAIAVELVLFWFERR